MKLFLQRTVGVVPREGEAETSAVHLSRFAWRPLVLGLLVVLGVSLLATAKGAVNVPPMTVAKIVASRLPLVDISPAWPSSWEAIVWDIRLPRVVVAGLVGMSLAMAGGTFQGLFRNPLADPYLIGVASGAGLAATVVMVSPIPLSLYGISLLPPMAFLGALMAVSLAYGLARVGGAVPTTTLILAGVAISFLASAVTTFLMLHVSPDVRPVLTWLLGGLSGSGWQRVAWILPYIIPCLLVIMAHGRVLNVLQLDEEQAQQLGINVERTKVMLIAAASLATAAAVSVSGMIGFVGLMAPHVVRLIWGPDYRFLLPMACVVGATLLMGSDLLARTVISPEEVPVGVITAFFGAPFFLYLLRQKKGMVF
ncbi:MAG: Iron transporter [Dehalococcoidia bacterium]|nr:Iron transporter [Dehalococcoidia bacterium]